MRRSFQLNCPCDSTSRTTSAHSTSDLKNAGGSSMRTCLPASMLSARSAQVATTPHARTKNRQNVSGVRQLPEQPGPWLPYVPALDLHVRAAASSGVITPGCNLCKRTFVFFRFRIGRPGCHAGKLLHDFFLGTCHFFRHFNVKPY